MNLASVTELLGALDGVAGLLTGWRLDTREWCLLDGPAIKLHQSDFDATPWRDHLNIYVEEDALSWRPQGSEFTMPPTGSAELAELLDLARSGIHLHIVPASRYYKAGFERDAVRLPSGRVVEAATLRGCSQVWSYKSAEVLRSIDNLEGDLERIVDERLIRLRVALAAASDDDTRERLVLLNAGYQALRNNAVSDATELFARAAGRAWNESGR